MNLFKDFDHKIFFVQSVTDLNFQVWQKFPLRKVFFIKVEILIDRLIKELHQIIDGLKSFSHQRYPFEREKIRSCFW